MKILIVGAGAVGGLFGAFLHRHGADVRFLVRPERQRQLEGPGLTLTLPSTQLHFRPKLVTAAELDGDYQLIVLSNKAYALPGVMDDIRAAVGESTRILPLLNGIRHLDLLDRQFGRERVLGGIAKTIATLADPTTISVSNPYSSLTIGARFPAQEAMVERVVALMTEAGITVEASEDIMGDMWDKFCRMAALGASNCLLQGTVGEYMQSRAGGDIALRLFHECTETAAAHGHPLGEAAIAGFQRALTNPGSRFNSSMYRDMQNGLPIEGEHLVGDMLSRAEQAGVPCPMLTVANAVLQTYSARLSGN
ncbi:2-dehydropantoate 2-reductase [Oceanisphaera litoralis]|uniref:ketopantoate reductase family protein n=1 Tax=Oceanisphaera litoralis TaxID=225144 RepID=UPI0019595A03|nr:ketopantoate reductase family protein [Oceanisphaera litoralis]MBM7456337.1 2-dehydropantoate 2-reductase [Oceanisphaera litoralis]